MSSHRDPQDQTVTHWMQAPAPTTMTLGFEVAFWGWFHPGWLVLVLLVVLIVVDSLLLGSGESGFGGGSELGSLPGVGLVGGDVADPGV